ncbi:TraR/DksA family transcriptional regulator [Dactylosporangium darangshiense]|jgi:DnaK suppressor protein|uniref:Zinc finger DksA/TraR C4-type domain-containing protein n=1 Tax=Dactylosporangium darangshiense TaxID=579108 RepID=A0ABP8CWK5_9ACTN|nr:TraR/DksA family transcriptional regulator [Dactylosporangium sp.]
MLVHPETRTEDIRAALHVRLKELEAEYSTAVAEMTLAGVADSGDDVADLGTKAFNREQEFALAVSIRTRVEQVERALERLEAGHYGTCENCGDEIPVARLAAFPSVTLCVGCKSRSESRY